MVATAGIACYGHFGGGGKEWIVTIVGSSYLSESSGSAFRQAIAGMVIARMVIGKCQAKAETAIWPFRDK